MTKKTKKRLFILVLILTFLYIGMGYTLKYQKLMENKECTVGTFIDIEKAPRGQFGRYQFFIDNIKFTGQIGRVNESYIGKSFLVIYQKDHPGNNFICLDNPQIIDITDSIEVCDCNNIYNFFLK